MLQVIVIRDLESFDALHAEWPQLLSRSRSNSITLTWPWLRTWWEIYQDTRSLRVITVRDDGRLIGAAPLLARDVPSSHYRVLPFRRFELLASGEAPADQICSDYIDWIAESGREAEVVGAVVGCLCTELSREWEELCLPDVSAESPNLGCIASEAGRRGLSVETLKREPCSVCRLPASWAEFLDGLGSGLRYKIRRGLREFERQGGSYQVVSSAGELPEAVRILVALHQQRWTAKGRAGAFRSERRRRFHETLMPLALEQGWLRLGILRVKDEPIGAIYNFRYAGKIAFYQSGITVPQNNHLRPGLIMHGLEIQSAIEAGCTEYDFLKRGHSDYKDAWTSETRDLLFVRIAKPGVKETTLRTLRATHNGLRSLKHRIVEQASVYGRSARPSSDAQADGHQS
jgi:CelD/BcsL family acetyltransferase involved in cellulose biosynthesis